MNKFLFSAALFSCFSGAYSADQSLTHSKLYNGWAAGINSGWVNSSMNVTDKSNSNKIAKINNLNHVNIGLHLDYHGTASNKLYYGMGIGGGTHLGKANVTFTNLPGFTFSQTRSYYGEVVGRLGMNLNYAVIYVLGAVKATNIEHKIEYSPLNLSSSDREVFWGIAPGIGADFNIGDRFSFGVEYRYFFEQSKDFMPNNQTLNVRFTHLRSHNVMSKISYHF